MRNDALSERVVTFQQNLEKNFATLHGISDVPKPADDILDPNRSANPAYRVTTVITSNASSHAGIYFHDAGD